MNRVISISLLLISTSALAQYEMNPITGTLSPVGATALRLGDDNTRLVQLGFTFNYFEQPFTQAWVSSNGFLSFSTNQNLCCDGVPIQNAPRNTIYGLWTDLISGQNPYIQTANSNGLQTFTVGWYQTSEYYNNRLQSFAIQLRSDDSFSILYGNITNMQYHNVLAGYTGPNADDNYLIYYGQNPSFLTGNGYDFSIPKPVIEPVIVDVGFNFDPVPVIQVAPVQTYQEPQIELSPVEQYQETFIAQEPVQQAQQEQVVQQAVQQAQQEVRVVEERVREEQVQRVQEVVREVTRETVREVAREVVKETPVESKKGNGDLSLSQIMSLVGVAGGDVRVESEILTEMPVSQSQATLSVVSSFSAISQTSQFYQSESSQSSAFYSGSYQSAGQSQDSLFQSAQASSGAFFSSAGYSSELAQTVTSIDVQGSSGINSQQTQLDILNLMSRPVREREKEKSDSPVAEGQSGTIDAINSVDLSVYSKAQIPSQPFYQSPSPYRKTLSDNDLQMFRMLRSNDAVYERLRDSQYGR